MTEKVIAAPTGKMCSVSPCQCKCWCKAEFRIRYEVGEDEYVGCAGAAGRIDDHEHGYDFLTFRPGWRSWTGEAGRRVFFLRKLFEDLEKQDPDKWEFHPERLIPLPKYWRDGAGRRYLPAEQD